MNASKLGICIVGVNGAVATSMIAGTELMKKGLAPRIGMISESLREIVDVAELDQLVYAGWDVRDESAYEAAKTHGVIPHEQLEAVREELISVTPWPTAASPDFLRSMQGGHLLRLPSFRDEIAALSEHVRELKRTRNLQHVVIVNLGSTERFTELADVHCSIDAFEAGLDASDPRISPAMKFLYVACKVGAPYVNFTPSRSLIPALQTLAERSGIAVAGEDGKTGQTMVKTALAPAFLIRDLQVQGWFSTNILGNNDGLVLNDPASKKSKVLSKTSALEEILGYPVEDHQVHIHYYKPRGDDKEAWDNIDIVGFLGQKMQNKINFLCKDSILAAPLVIDLSRLIDCAQRHGGKGIQRQLSLFFKAPYHLESERAEHDLFKQHRLLIDWAREVERDTSKRGA